MRKPNWKRRGLNSRAQTTPLVNFLRDREARRERVLARMPAELREEMKKHPQLLDRIDDL